MKISQELEDKASNALRSKEELETKFALLSQCWQNEIKWKAQQLETSAAGSNEAEFDMAQFDENLIKDGDLLLSSEVVTSLPAWDRLISLSLITLVRMGSLTGVDTTEEMTKNMQRLSQLGANIATATVAGEAEKIPDLWQLFKKEILHQIAILNKTNAGDVEADVEEEIKRFVHDLILFIMID